MLSRIPLCLNDWNFTCGHVKWKDKEKNASYAEKKKLSEEIVLEEAQVLGLLDKDFKLVFMKKIQRTKGNSV